MLHAGLEHEIPCVWVWRLSDVRARMQVSDMLHAWACNPTPLPSHTQVTSVRTISHGACPLSLVLSGTLRVNPNPREFSHLTA